MEIQESKFFEMAATIVAGMAANPANGNLLNDQYAIQQAIGNTVQALGQVMVQSGINIVQGSQ